MLKDEYAEAWMSVSRYERAVKAGNEATLAMSRAPAAVQEAEPDEEEDDLAESLARARRAAAQRAEAAGAGDGASAVAEEAAKRREEEESAQTASLLNNDGRTAELTSDEWLTCHLDFWYVCSAPC